MRVIKEMSAGRRGAVLVSATPVSALTVPADAAGAEPPIECVVKLNARLTVPPLEHLVEYVCSRLAQELGVTTPTPYAVEIRPALAAACFPPLRDVVAKSVGLSFGSGWVGHPAMPIVEPVDVHGGMRASASTVLAFDIFVHNVDRRVGNPNLLEGRGKYVAIDHGDALAFVFPLIGAPDPITDALAEFLPKHIFAAPLRKKFSSMDGFRAALARLTDEKFESLRESTPSEWQTSAASGMLGRIMDVLSKRRDAVDQWLRQVELWMHR